MAGDDVTAQQIKRLVADRQYPEAVRACRRALLSRPDNIPIRILLGISLLALQRHEEVRSEMLVVLRTNPKEAMAYRILGEAYLNDGRPGRAKAPLQQAISLMPGDTEAQRLLKDAQERDTGDGDEEGDTLDRWFDPEAVATVQRHVDAPDDSETRRGEVYVRPSGSPSSSGKPAPTPSSSPRPSRPPGARFPSSAGQVATPRASSRAPAPPVAPLATRSQPPPSGSRTSSGKPSLPPPVPSNRPSRSPVSQPPRLPSQPPVSRSVRPSTPTGASGKPSEGRGNVYAGRTASGLLAPRLPTGVSGGTGELEPGALPSRPSEAGALRSPPAGLFNTSGVRNPSVRSGAPALSDTEDHALFGADDDDENKATAILDRDSYAGIDALAGVHDDDPTAANAPSFSPHDFAAKTDVEPDRSQSPFLSNATTEVDATENPLWSLGNPTAGASAETAPEAELPQRRPSGPTFPTTPHWTPSTSGSAPKGSTTERLVPFDPNGGSYHTIVKGAPKWSFRSRALVIGTAVLAAVAIAVFAVVFVNARRARDASIAVGTAFRDGRPSVWSDAIAATAKFDGGAQRGLRAQLLGAALYEQGMGSEADVAKAVHAAQANDPAGARIAGAYLNLARGDIAGAEDALGSPKDTTAEGWYVTALVRNERGNFAGALDAARRAVRADPASTRYAVLRTWLEARTDPRAVTEPLLAGIAGGEALPSVRIARARILTLTPDNDHLSGAEAAAVRDRLGNDATPREKAWAHALGARDALRLGDRTRALTLAQAAMAVPNVGPDAALFGEVAVDLLRAQDGKGALAALDRIPKEVANSPEWNAVAAAAHLLLGDTDQAAALLQTAGKDPFAEYFRGRLFELRGNRTAAAKAYEAGVGDRRTASDATTGLASIRLDDGDAKGAIEALDALPLGALVTESMEAIRVRALLKLGKKADAETRLTAALKSRPDSVPLKLARAEMWLAAGRATDALAEARTLAAGPTADAQTFRLLGRAAVLTGATEDADRAFAKLAVLAPNDPVAKVGLAQVALAHDDFDKADELLAPFATSKDTDVLRVRGQLLVRRGAGKIAADMLAPFAARTKDAALLNAYGMALFQQEEENRAQKIFSRVLTLDKRNPEAELGTALVSMRGGALGAVESHLNVADKESKARNLGPFFAARLLAARARLAFEFGNLKLAQTRATEALKLYPKLGEAHLVLADVEIDRNGRPVTHLENAKNGVMTPPEAIGQLALRTTGADACTYAKQYLASAPAGFDAKRVQAVAKKCR